jgi:hypothetical protein
MQINSRQEYRTFYYCLEAVRDNRQPFPANIEGDCPLSYVASCHIIYDCLHCWTLNYPHKNGTWKRNE